MLLTQVFFGFCFGRRLNPWKRLQRLSSESILWRVFLIVGCTVSLRKRYELGDISV